MRGTKLAEVAVSRFPGVAWTSSGENRSRPNSRPKYVDGWVKFGVKKSELGWRTAEFLAWAFGDLSKAGYHVHLLAVSAPPYLNTPGRMLEFVAEFDLLTPTKGKTIERAAEYLDEWRLEYWSACAPRKKRTK
jgi:hypothetical protein